MSTATTATEALWQEHQVILRAVGLLEVAAGRLSAGRALPEGWWDSLVEWLRLFADRGHHGKEERHLFPALAQAGVPVAGGPVGVMLDEHAEGRALIGAMAAGPAEGRAQAARRYVELLRDHIGKEDAVLLPLADGVLAAHDQRRLARAFEQVEAELAISGGRAAAQVDGLEAALGK